MRPSARLKTKARKTRHISQITFQVNFLDTAFNSSFFFVALSKSYFHNKNTIITEKVHHNVTSFQTCLQKMYF